MRIQTKLILLFVSIAIPLLLNLLVLVFVVISFRAVTLEIQQLFEQQDQIRQVVASLNNAETLIYQYQIDGDIDFADQYQAHNINSTTQVDVLNAQMSDESLSEWLNQLAETHEASISVGTDLIQLQQQQMSDLIQMQTLTDELSARLLDQLQFAESPQQFQQITEMMRDVYRLERAVVTHLASPHPSTRTAFTEAAIAWNTNFNALTGGDDRELVRQFNEIETIGARIINDRDEQNLQFAAFASNQFFINEQIISDRILPHTTQIFLDSQASLVKRITLQTILSIGIAIVGVITSLMIAFPMLRQLYRSIHNLLDGANRVSEGNYDTQVIVKTRDETQQLATIFNTMMAELKNREQRLQKRIMELEVLRHKFTIVQEEERRLVGLDLHDGVTQMLLSANMHINTVAALQDKMTEPAKSEFEMVQQRVKEAIDEVRWVVSELRPTELEDYGMIDGIRNYVNKVAHHQGWRVTFVSHVPDEIQDLVDSAVEIALFRIIQESLSNASKHAESETISVSIVVEDQAIHAEVMDAGAGFDPMILVGRDLSQLGLIGMQDRATAVGGNVEMQSRPGHGTIVKIDLPLQVRVQAYFNASG